MANWFHVALTGETDATQPIQYSEWKEAQERGHKRERGSQWKKNVKGKARNRCCDSPWKPWTLIARWRSRCKSAFPATVMIAGVVSASTSASQTVLRCTPQPREKQSITSRLRTPDFTLFFPFTHQIWRRGQENVVRNYCRWKKCCKHACVYPWNAILIAYASLRKNAESRVYVFVRCIVAINWRISLARENIIDY